MPVYMFAAPSLGLCKIGHTDNVAGRLTYVRNACPVPLEFVCERPGGMHLERAIHARLEAHRSYREWFRMFDGMEAIFHSVEDPKPSAAYVPAPKPVNGCDLQAAIKERGLRLTQVADAIGVDKSVVTRWCQRAVPLNRVAQLAAVTGIPPEAIRPELFIRQPEQR